MPYLELTIKTASSGIEQVAACLTSWGYDSFIIDDEAEYAQFLEQNRVYWDYIDEALQAQLCGLSQIRLYIEDDAQAAGKVQALQDDLAALRLRRQDLDLGPLTVSARPLPDEDWENSWKDNYPPVPVGKNLMVLPCWLPPEAAQGRTAIVLDPGLTFGTGAHPSTQMCMCRLEERISGGEKVIDLGSGSGILSICALNLGAESAVGVDVDSKAESIARENAAYNGFASPEFTALTGNVTEDKELMDALASKEYDLVLVNIVADVIIGLSPILPSFLTEKSTLICSGILDVRLEEVIAALEKAGLAVTAVKQQEDWRCVTARKPSV